MVKKVLSQDFLSLCGHGPSLSAGCFTDVTVLHWALLSSSGWTSSSSNFTSPHVRWSRAKTFEWRKGEDRHLHQWKPSLNARKKRGSMRPVPVGSVRTDRTRHWPAVENTPALQAAWVQRKNCFQMHKVQRSPVPQQECELLPRLSPAVNDMLSPIPVPRISFSRLLISRFGNCVSKCFFREAAVSQACRHPLYPCGKTYSYWPKCLLSRVRDKP